ncbi:hypothetical protein I7V28_19720 [Lelliottia amnigena]|uniref:hypothetical protein n=1 Tax=Lelliottia TaxID=1330545 RepID=UPI00192B0CB5|nr:MULTISPECIES: hypothetical protein [Lelliottia]MBL5885727.1 hypothetical protein [Lelliottia aquatilis]MBL5923306.1 hypothetical protein [Lelliottia amnigena]MBL5932215.1 hypothetical protein [Lelliottia amnigena]
MLASAWWATHTKKREKHVFSYWIIPALPEPTLLGYRVSLIRLHDTDRLADTAQRRCSNGPSS